MQEPHPDVSSEPLFSAFRIARVLGWICIVLGTLAIAVVWVFVPRSTPRWGFAGLMLGLIAFYVGPGIVYVGLADSLRQYRAWAVTTVLVVASLQAVVMSVGVFWSAVQNNTCSIVIGGVMVVLIALLIMNLTKSYRVIREQYMVRGFEPIMPAQAMDEMNRRKS